MRSDVAEILAETRQARCRLSFAEVVEVGLPAAYYSYGERLVFLDGRLFEVNVAEMAVEIPTDGPSGLGATVGIEFGWCHARGCSCRFCARHAQSSAQQSFGLGDAAAPPF